MLKLAIEEGSFGSKAAVPETRTYYPRIRCGRQIASQDEARCLSRHGSAKIPFMLTLGPHG